MLCDVDNSRLMHSHARLYACTRAPILLRVRAYTCTCMCMCVHAQWNARVNKEHARLQRVTRPPLPPLLSYREKLMLKIVSNRIAGESRDYIPRINCGDCVDSRSRLDEVKLG